MNASRHPTLIGTPPGQSCSGPLLRAFTMMGLAWVVLAGCTLNPEELVLTRAEVEERTLFHPVPVSQAWVNAPGIRSAMQRDMRGSSEQQLNLVNQTVVQGDNLLVLRTRGTFEGQARFRFEEFVTRLGGALPYPFETLAPGDLTQSADELGDYFWAQERMGEGVVCIVGLRRLDSSMRQMPLGAAALDVMMRNCVNGTAEAAMVPLLASSLSVVPMAADGQGESRMLSPLAGPTAGARRIPE